MTAIIAVCQPRRNLVHIVTDAAMYLSDQTVVAFANKSAPVAQWPGLVTAMGSAFNIALFRAGLAQKFATWDAMIAHAESELPSIAESYGLSWSSVLLAGISKERGPEIYQFTNDVPPPDLIAEDASASPTFAAPYKLVKLPEVIVTPPVSDAGTIIAADWEGFDVDADPALVVWSMRKHLAMQRHMPLPVGVGGIGGFAELTTISPDGITQRIIERWPDDKIGAPLHHGPISWDQWDADNPKPGMSRLKRDMLERKARKFGVVK